MPLIGRNLNASSSIRLLGRRPDERGQEILVSNAELGATR